MYKGIHPLIGRIISEAHTTRSTMQENPFDPHREEISPYRPIKKAALGAAVIASLAFGACAPIQYRDNPYQPITPYMQNAAPVEKKDLPPPEMTEKKVYSEVLAIVSWNGVLGSSRQETLDVARAFTEKSGRPLESDTQIEGILEGMAGGKKVSVYANDAKESPYLVLLSPDMVIKKADLKGVAYADTEFNGAWRQVRTEYDPKNGSYGRIRSIPISPLQDAYHNVTRFAFGNKADEGNLRIAGKDMIDATGSLESIADLMYGHGFDRLFENSISAPFLPGSNPNGWGKYNIWLLAKGEDLEPLKFSRQPGKGEESVSSIDDLKYRVIAAIVQPVTVRQKLELDQSGTMTSSGRHLSDIKLEGNVVSLEGNDLERKLLEPVFFDAEKDGNNMIAIGRHEGASRSQNPGGNEGGSGTGDAGGAGSSGSGAGNSQSGSTGESGSF